MGRTDTLDAIANGIMLLAGKPAATHIEWHPFETGGCLCRVVRRYVNKRTGIAVQRTVQEAHGPNGLEAARTLLDILWGTW